MCGIFFCARCIDGKPSEDGYGSDSSASDLFQRLQLANSARGSSNTIFYNIIDPILNIWWVPIANNNIGPDAQKVIKTFLEQVDQEKESNDVDRRHRIDDLLKPGLALEFFASELRLRGNNPIVQPHERDGNMFCFNGEVSFFQSFLSDIRHLLCWISKIFSGMEASRVICRYPQEHSRN